MNQRFPEFESGWVTASKLAMEIDEPRIAVRALDRALALSPGKPALLLWRLECLVATGDTGKARVMARQLAALEFPLAAQASRLALQLNRLGMFGLARVHYERCCELEPGNGEHWYNLATVERFSGNIAAAQAAVDHCIALRPDDADAHFLRAGLRTQTAESNNVEALESARERSEPGGRDRIRLCYALAKELEDLGEHERSFACLAEGAGQRRARMRYTPGHELRVLEALRQTFTADMFDGHIQGHASAEPIFVVGMPRTGTTLVDRILGSHSVVSSSGELRAFAVELTRACRGIPGGPARAPGDLVVQSRNIDFEALGEAYVVAARPEGADVAHFVDKLPLNFLYAGLIHLALPNAKIVVLERDPMDTCYAVFKTLFEGIYPFSYDLEELAHYFVAYRRLIVHWEHVMPGVMHTVSYERLVSDPKPVVQDLLDYCNLSYEDACLEYQANPEATTTASAVQVRSGFSTRSIGMWKHYRKHLQPVEAILRDAGIL